MFNSRCFKFLIVTNVFKKNHSNSVGDKQHMISTIHTAGPLNVWVVLGYFTVPVLPPLYARVQLLLKEEPGGGDGCGRF